MASKRKLDYCRPITRAMTKAARKNTSSPAKPVAPMTGAHVHIPHHVMLEVFSFLEPRAIVRARTVARAFARDAPALIRSLQCSAQLKFPQPTEMDLFPRMEKVEVRGDHVVVKQAAPGLARCGSLRSLTIACHLPQQSPLPGDVTTTLFGLQLSDLDIQKIWMDIPPALNMTAWRTLRSLVLRDAGLSDTSLVNIITSMPCGAELPLRHLDLSRNQIGQMEGIGPLAEALHSFPELDILELTANRITDSAARRLLSTLLNGACPRLTQLELSLNFLHDECMDYLAKGVTRDDHGLRELRKLCIGGRFMPSDGAKDFRSLSRSIAAGCLPKLHYFHVQGDLTPASVGPFLGELRSGVCPMLKIVKMERSTRFPADDDSGQVEGAILNMRDFVMSKPSVPFLSELHVLGMHLGRGLETGWAEEEARTFYRAEHMSTFHRLASAGATRGVMIFV